MTDQELRDLVASLAVKSDRLDAQQARTDAQMARTDEKLNRLFELYGGVLGKTDVQMGKTDEQLKTMWEQYAVASSKTDAQMAKTDAQMAKTDEKLNRLSDLYGGVSSNQGSAAEEFFFNTLNANPVVGGIHFDRVTPNVNPNRKSKSAEFDIVMVNGTSVAVVEVKYKVHPSDIEKATKNLKRYREFFPEHKNYALYGGIACFSVPQDAVKAAKEKGLFVLKRVGEVLKMDAKDMRAFE